MEVVHIALSEYQGDMPHAANCPDPNPEPESGFGLAGGGYGAYSYCPHCGALLSKVCEGFDDAD